jgi:hypothetical protein
MTHAALPTELKSLLSRNFAISLSLGIAGALAWRIYDTKVIIPRREDYYKQLAAIKEKERQQGL